VYIHPRVVIPKKEKEMRKVLFVGMGLMVGSVLRAEGMIGDLRLREGAEQERILPQQQVEETPAMRKEDPRICIKMYRPKTEIVKKCIRLDSAGEGLSYAVYNLEVHFPGGFPPFYVNNFVDKERPLPYQERTVMSKEGRSMIETFVTLPYGEEYMVNLRVLH
jgi:hypothetical protein